MTEGKHAVVLAGEGARGAFQAGVLRRLYYDSKINPEMLIGISSGSVNAVGYAYLGPNENYAFWKSIKSIKDVYGINYLSWWYKSGLLNTKITEEKTKKIIMFNRPRCTAIVARSSAKTGKVEYISNKDFHIRNIREKFMEATVDSIRIAGLVESRDHYIDAGASALAPIGEALRRGATKIDVIIARPLEINEWDEKSRLKFTGYAFRSLDLTFHRIIFNDLKIANMKNKLAGFKKLDVTVHVANEYLADAVDFNMCGELAVKGFTGQFSSHKLEELFPN